LAAAIVLDIAGGIFTYRDAYERDPWFARVGLASAYQNDGSVLVESNPGSGTPTVEEGSRIVAVNGRTVARDTKVWALAKLLQVPDEQPVILIIEGPTGNRTLHRVTPVAVEALTAQEPLPIRRDARIATRLTISLLTCLALIACAILLFLRRPRDPVALLFSFSFLLFACSIDPPVNMWSAFGYGTVYYACILLAWICLVVGIAAFPDGRFVPGSMRWIMVAAPIAAIPLGVDAVPAWLQALIACALPLALLASTVAKYRRFDPGIERQQIKWAAFGFASGLCLLAAAMFLAEAIPYASPWLPLYALVVLVLFNGAFLAMVAGLLVSLIRFRLWEADRVISRSAVSAGVTLGVGIVWTLSMDLVKTAVEMTLGEENLPVATAAGAVLAAGIFAPTQALALRWAKRRFDGENNRIRNLISRLAVWRTSETPEEIGMRSLSALAAAVHCSSAAIVLDTPHGRTVVASRDLDDAERLADPGTAGEGVDQFVMHLPLEDEDGPIGQLLLGPRSDANRYSSSQVAALRKVSEPLAESLRAAVKRAQHSDSVHRLLGSVEERLARLEIGSGGGLTAA